jgi:hypothetical protein
MVLKGAAHAHQIKVAEEYAHDHRAIGMGMQDLHNLHAGEINKQGDSAASISFIDAEG